MEMKMISIHFDALELTTLYFIKDRESVHRTNETTIGSILVVVLLPLRKFTNGHVRSEKDEIYTTPSLCINE
ncbi:hypothetical protein BLOT_003534 [Blomia tropicalis]|nr:hypothetical protein BLOT_003534 [Blomia tropicalis]